MYPSNAIPLWDTVKKLYSNVDNALLEKGLIKVRNFKSSKRKLSYAYLLTPDGIAERAVLSQRFLRSKMEEYELLKAEIELLKQQVPDK